MDLVSDGASGGIFIIRDRRVIEMINHSVGNYVLAGHFRNIDNGVD